jgi:hypothetical protein
VRQASVDHSVVQENDLAWFDVDTVPLVHGQLSSLSNHIKSDFMPSSGNHKPGNMQLRWQSAPASQVSLVRGV